MSVAAADPSPQLQPSPVLRAISVTGLLLFMAGAVLPLFVSAHSWIAVLRWAGLFAVASTGLWGQSLTRWILFAMLLGGEIGLDRPQFAEHLRVFSEIFLRLIKVIVAPLIFGTLVTGISGHGNLRGVGRIGLKSLIYFEVVTTLALFLGVAAINLSRAGEGLAISPNVAVVQPQSTATLHWDDFLLHVFPENIAKSVAENQILQVAVFAVLFGIALARLPEAKRAPMLKFCESLTETMFSFTNLVMYFAPVGVGAAIAYTVGHMGIGVLLPLGKCAPAVSIRGEIVRLGFAI